MHPQIKIHVQSCFASVTGTDLKKSAASMRSASTLPPPRAHPLWLGGCGGGRGVGPKRTTTGVRGRKKRGIGEEEEEGFGTRSERGAGAPPEAPPPVGGAHVPLRRRPSPWQHLPAGTSSLPGPLDAKLPITDFLSPAPDGYEAPHPLLAGLGPGKPTVNTPQDNVLPGSGLLLLAGKLFHSNWEYLSNPCSAAPLPPGVKFPFAPRPPTTPPGPSPLK
ncbi:hypothetical protein CEXT_452611 [Caerostris extrusa]|uniref:Uncharacterized protein n=1 Tax=Caerostris extrusa TaxID=172846 RepID=A0AAV4PLN6_CAEEX|nr:hypothetical protein CEXT_452611 [Caerostris extrusa]